MAMIRMPANYIGKPDRLFAAASALAAFVGLVVLAFVLAYWSWRATGPAPDVPALPQDDGRWAATLASSHFFGSEPLAPPAEAQTASAQLQPLGIIAQPDGGGYALIRLPDRTTRLFSVGDEVVPGVTLERVDNDQVSFRSAERTSVVALRGGATASTPPAASLEPAPARPKASAVCPLGADDRAHAYYLHSELLDGVAKAPRTWEVFLRARAGGLEVAQDAGIGRVLGLEPADRLERSNGVQLASVDDLDRAFIRPLQRNEVVRITGVRNGAPMQWIYVNSALCAGKR
jgi:hypothetical protein